MKHNLKIIFDWTNVINYVKICSWFFHYDQSVKFIEACFENGRSNIFGVVRGFYFAQYNRAFESAIGNNVTLLGRGTIPARDDKS